MYFNICPIYYKYKGEVLLYTGPLAEVYHYICNTKSRPKPNVLTKKKWCVIFPDQLFSKLVWKWVPGSHTLMGWC